MKVYPGDIDAVASQFPAVVDVCTFAVTDPLHGQNVGIALVIGAAMFGFGLFTLDRRDLKG